MVAGQLTIRDDVATIQSSFPIPAIITLDPAALSRGVQNRQWTNVAAGSHRVAR